MLRVGLTGGIGSGKSTAAAIFAELGCFVSQSDEVARTMMQPGEPVYKGIVAQFGPAVTLPDGSLDRTALARIAFADGRVEELNGIIHPAVIAWHTQWLRRIGEEHPDGIAIIESALLFETRHGAAAGDGKDPGDRREPAESSIAPWRTRFDRVVLITAAEPLRIQRYVDRYIARASASSHSEPAAVEADARARMEAQLPDAEKRAWADAVVENNGSLEELRRLVTEVWHKLRREGSVALR